MTDFDPLDGLRPVFVQWFDARIRLDVKSIALRTPPTLDTGVDALYGAFFRWSLERDQAPPTRDRFLALLTELGCQMHTVGEEFLVANVALKEGAQAHDQNPPPAPAKTLLHR
jgi:hypothetical protein